jgi:hypothetical protein
MENNSGLKNTVMMISVHIGNNLLYGYYVAHPVYDVAVRQIRQLYPTSLGNMEYVNIYLPGYDLCQDGGDNTARFFAKFYFENPRIFRSAKVFPIIFSPGKYFLQRVVRPGQTNLSQHVTTHFCFISHCILLTA